MSSFPKCFRLGKAIFGSRLDFSKNISRSRGSFDVRCDWTSSNQCRNFSSPVLQKTCNDLTESPRDLIDDSDPEESLSQLDELKSIVEKSVTDNNKLSKCLKVIQNVEEDWARLKLERRNARIQGRRGRQLVFLSSDLSGPLVLKGDLACKVLITKARVGIEIFEERHGSGAIINFSEIEEISNISFKEKTRLIRRNCWNWMLDSNTWDYEIEDLKGAIEKQTSFPMTTEEFADRIATAHNELTDMLKYRIWYDHTGHVYLKNIIPDKKVNAALQALLSLFNFRRL